MQRTQHTIYHTVVKDDGLDEAGYTGRDPLR